MHRHYNVNAGKKALTVSQKERKAAIEKAKQHDAFRTPRYVFRHLIEQHPYLFTPKRTERILDPSAGDGRYIAMLIKEFGLNKVGHCLVDIRKSELKVWEAKTILTGCVKRIGNFFEQKTRGRFTMAITNPPFRHSKAFIEKMLDSVVDGGIVIVFEKLAFLGGQNRAAWLDKDMPLKYTIIIPYRIAFDIDGVVQSDPPMYCFAFYVFQKGFEGEARIRYIHKEEKSVVKRKKK